MQIIKRRVVFLDRDGTIIKDKGYMYEPRDIEFIDGAVEALRRIQKKYLLVVVTNQSGVGRGKFTAEDCEIFNRAFLEECKRYDVSISALLCCTHSPDDNCDCRKPKTALINKWLNEKGLCLDKDNSYVVGDKKSDIELAENLGINGILISNTANSSKKSCRVVSCLNELWR